MKWADAIREALFYCRLVGEGQTPSASDMQRGLTYFRILLSDWSRDGLIPPAFVSIEAPLVGGQNTYLAGAGQHFDRRPVSLYQAILFGGALGIQQIPIRIAEWTEWEAQTMPSAAGQPKAVYYNPTYPYGTFAVYPTPATNYTLRLFGNFEWENIELTDDVSLPPGFIGPIIDNGAVRIAQNYGMEISPWLANRARDGLGSIRISLPSAKDATRTNLYAFGNRSSGNLWNFKIDAPT